jgi:hypothetical protein
MPRNRYCSSREYDTSDSESDSCQCKRCEKEKHRKCSKKHETYKCSGCHRKLKEIKCNRHHNHNNCCNNEDNDNCKKDCQDGKVILITIS